MYKERKSFVIFASMLTLKPFFLVFTGISIPMALLSCSSGDNASSADVQNNEKTPSLSDSCVDYEDGDVKYFASQDKYYQCKDEEWIAVEVSVESSSSVSAKSSSSVVSSSSSKENDIPVVESACKNGDILYSKQDSTYQQCENGEWVDYEIPKEKSSSSSVTSSSSKELSSSSALCEDGDKLLTVFDSTYHECKGGSWIDLDETWIIKKDTNSYLEVAEGRYLPEAGFYKPFAIRAPKALKGGIVRCTFDGSVPNDSSLVFTESVLIDSTMSVRCAEFIDSVIVKSNSETYFINEDVDMPIVSISTSPNFKLYLDTEPCTPSPCREAIFWEDVEFPAHVEYFANGSKTLKKSFEIEAGVAISGGWSRNQVKKSIAVEMHDRYQKGTFTYPLFSVRPEANVFKGFTLRNSGQRCNYDYFTDAAAMSLLENANVDYQRSLQVIVYIDGEFYGIYDLKERLNEHFIQTNYGIPSGQVEMLSLKGPVAEAQQGSNADYKLMLKFISSTDFSDTSSTAYEELKNMMDISSYVDYMAAEIYYNNADWPVKNIRIWRTLGSPWKFIAFDIDQGLGMRNQTNIVERIIQGGGVPETNSCYTKKNYCFPIIFTKLVENPEFLRYLLNRSSYLYAATINSEKINAAIDAVIGSIDSKQVERDLGRFPRSPKESYCSGKFDLDGACVKAWCLKRDRSVREDYRRAFELGEDAKIVFETRGAGKIVMEDVELPDDLFSAVFYVNIPILLTAKPDSGFEFVSWEDGSTDNPRMVVPVGDSTFVAKFKEAS